MVTLTKQINKEEYTIQKYGHIDRFVSYAHQLREIAKCNPKTMLEIGVGDRLVGNYIRNNTAIHYTSADIADDVGADVIASVTELPFEDNSFDVACAFEVLEHLPYDLFDTALSELARVSKKDVLISLPHFAPPIKFLLKLPFLPELKFAFKVPYPRVHKFDGQHYWEIGKKGYSVAQIREKLQKYFEIRNEYVPFGNQYHHFFVLTKKV